MTNPQPPQPDSSAPWRDPATTKAPTEATTALRHAELFSRAIHGAALTYNLLVAQRYEAKKLTRVPTPVDTYRQHLLDWAEAISADQRLTSWNQDDMWQRVINTNPRIATNPTARHFLHRWLTAVTNGAAADMARSSQPTTHNLAALIADRERTVKKSQSRLLNDALLRTWSGHSGSARLTYRWAQVRRMVRDIYTGQAAHASP